MARVTYVKSARASRKERRCVNCGHIIQTGETYKHAGLKTGPRSSIVRNWCASCTPKQSQLTMNDRMSRLYEIQEGLQHDLAHADDLESLKSSFETAADEAEEVATEYEESADNMPENLQQGSQAEEMRDKASTIRQWAEELRNALDDVDEYDPDKCTECGDDRDAEQHQEDEGLSPDEIGGKEPFDHDFEEPEAPNFADIELPDLSL